MEKQDQSFLFAAFQRGEEQAFTYFFRLYYQPLCFFAKQYVTDCSAAEDVVSAVFIKVWEKRAIINDAKGLKAYLYRAVRNGCLNEKRRVVSSELREEDASGELRDVSEENNYIVNIIKAETLQELYTGMAYLPLACRQIFTKLYVEGKTVRETAAELKLAISTVKAQKAKGLKLLRLRLENLMLLVGGCWFVVVGI